MTFYAAEVKALQTCAKHKAVHTLVKELDGDNAAARVAAARTLVMDDPKPAPSAGQSQTPGFVFMVVDARGGEATSLNGNAAPLLQIEARPDEGHEPQR